MLSRQTGALSRLTPTLARNDAVMRTRRRLVRNLKRSTDSSQGWLRLLRPHHAGDCALVPGSSG